MTFFGFFRPTQKMARDGPKWGREVLFPTNPDLADILGRTDFDFENFYFLFVFWISNFQISRFPDFQIPRPRRGPGLGRTAIYFFNGLDVEIRPKWTLPGSAPTHPSCLSTRGGAIGRPSGYTKLIRRLDHEAFIWSQQMVTDTTDG